MAVTLGEVARHAGVSLATASRALNGSARTVSDALAARVRASAEELGYLANAPAQALARASTATVGVLLHDIADPYFGALAKGATDTAAGAGLLTMVLNTGGDPATELRCIRMLHAQRVRAIVLAGSGYTDPAATAAIDAALTAYRAEGGVVAAVTDHGDGYDTVLPDNRGGAAALTRALLAAGHRDLAVVTGPARFRVSAERLGGVREALADVGLTIRQEWLEEAEFSREGGHLAARRLLDRTQGSRRGTGQGRGNGQGREPGLPDAILALSDVCAVGVLSELRERGISVPDGIAVAGFDDIPLAADLAPALTTARMPLEQMGAAAIRLAMRRADGREPQGTGPQGAGAQGAGVQGAGVQGTHVQGAHARGTAPPGMGPHEPRPDGAGPRGAPVRVLTLPVGLALRASTGHPRSP
jgi:LacI family transcriptional regulator